MKVACENCETKLNLPDDKLVPGQDFSFNCPKCKSKNTISVPGPENEAPQALSPMDEVDLGDDSEGGLGEFYEEGAKLALVCFDAGPVRERLVRAMEDMGYVAVIPTNTRDALKRIKVTQFNAILLHDNYEGQGPDHNVLLRVLQPMDMGMRRKIYLALFGDGYQTLDHMTAFKLSVNTVINMKDQNQFGKIVYRGLAEHERFYRAFFDVMREIGKF